MSLRRLALFSVLLLLVAGTATALNPVNVGVTSSNSYLTANNIESSQIIISVTDGTWKAIGGANVLLEVPAPWGLADTTGVTNAGGVVVTTFLPTTVSGTATITATVTVPGITTEPVVRTYNQNIVADVPAKAVYSYPSTVSVGSINDITVRVTDRYGNPVTSTKQPNLVSFTTTLGGDSGFLISGHHFDVKVKALSVALNDSGYAETNFAVSTRAGDNFVYIGPPAPLPANLIRIQGIANLPPETILQTVTPQGKPPTLTTDGVSRFILTYDLLDKYGNPSAHQNLSISTTGGEAMVITSSSEGKVAISYGPRTLAGRYTITARSQENSKVSVTQVVQFLSGKATNMLLTASPQTMASLDVKPDAVAWVTGKVIDASGNPVAGETVCFSIQSVNTGA
ncbi:MAG: hypothetical protein LUO91_07115, partial [Methanomicrobiales archaeon]|nr:hypothetical protein [Methanomicrobiales archaeon]